MINNVYFGINGGLIIVASTSCDAYLRVTQDKIIIYDHPISPETYPEICWVDIPKINQTLEVILISKQGIIDRIIVNDNPAFFNAATTSDAWKWVIQ